MLLPYRSKNPPESLPIVTILLIVVNTFVFFLTSNGFEAKEGVIQEYGLKAADLNLGDAFASLFLHADILHLLGNMWFLYLFGFAVEGRLKAWRFAPLYLLSGFVGDAAHLAVVGGSSPDIPSIGASGAIMGVLGAAIYMFPHAKMDFFYWFGIFWRGVFTWPMWGVGLWYLGFDAIMAFLTSGGGGVARLAHLGGALGGFVMAAALRPIRDSEMASDAKATYTETKDLSLLSRMELAAMAGSRPDDPLLALHWMHRGLQEAGGPKPESVAAFQRLLPEMLVHLPPQSISGCVHGLEGRASFAPGQLLDLAQRLERCADLAGALQTYEMVLRDPKAKPEDTEAALFRGGLACERMGRVHQAMAAYQEVVRRNGMGPFGEPARLRISALRSSPQSPSAVKAP